MPNPEKRFQDFVEFLVRFIDDMNDSSREGAVVLVEGRRDAAALTELGYTGLIVTRSTVRSSQRSIGNAQVVILLTDLDSEGRRLAAAYIKFFARRGIETSLTFRKRLSEASRGRFLHIENLIRFAPLPIGKGTIDDHYRRPLAR